MNHLFFKRLLIVVCAGLLLPMKSWAVQTIEKPRLVVILVVDQLRPDQLLLNEARLRKTGYKTFLQKGAFIPYAQYPVLQNMTCPGHAMIVTGSVPAMNKIPLNEWYDSKEKRMRTCVFDKSEGLSPRSLQGTTIGDEMKLAWPGSKVVALSLKDRSAIMLGGHAADAAYWSNGELDWTTSSYYKNVPDGLRKFSIQETPKAQSKVTFKNVLSPRIFEHSSTLGEGKSLASTLSLNLTMQAATHVFKSWKLGADDTPDLFALSLSTHDLVGHVFGPTSPEADEILLQEDVQISEWLAFLDANVPGGLSKVWIVLTSDHGSAPNVEEALKLNLNAGRISAASLQKQMNQALTRQFGPCRENYVLAFKSFNFYFSPTCWKKKRDQVLQKAKEILQQTPGVETAFSVHDFESRSLPLNFQQEIEVSYVPGRSGDLVLIPKPFWYELDGPPTTHMTSYNYDRHVPIAFLGKPFKPSHRWAAAAQVIDIAPTLSSLLGIQIPAQSKGRLLGEILAE
jgi:predicted AlkP superfamily pyrophosphatase or phosphodiesterase